MTPFDQMMRKYFAPRSLPAAAIIRTVAEQHQVSVRDIMSPNKARIFSRPRQEVYLALHQQGWSYSRIARRMKRDHSTVVHGIRRVLGQ